MGCHKIAAADKPEIKKVAEFFAKKESIPWVRVNKLPEFTYFPHKAHLRAKLKCQECHGAVETMTTFAAETGPRLTNDLLNLVGLRPAARPLQKPHDRSRSVHGLCPSTVYREPSGTAG